MATGPGKYDELATHVRVAVTSACTHGVTFDEKAAKDLLATAPPPKDAVDFVMGNPKSAEVRRRWPRGQFTEEVPCPSCGYVGIYYASTAHYVMGDW